MRRVAFLLVGLCFAASGVACSSARERAPEPEATGSASAPIINGTLDTTHDAVVAILTQSSQDQGSGCTGTIVKVDGAKHIGWVVTAAHCVDFTGLDPKKIYVVQGEDYNKSTSILYRTIDFKIHPSWDPNAGFDYDFAVLRIAGVDASTPVIPLTSSPDGLALGTQVMSVGYGKTDPSPSSTAQNSLRYSIVKTLGSVTTSQIAFSETGGGICQGDSGGPVLVGASGSQKVVGIHSYVSGGCQAGDGGHSSRVTFGLSFLNQQLNAALPADDCNLCEMIANSGTQECAAITQTCYGDPECQGYFDCLKSGETYSTCTKKFPKIEGMYAAVATCTCSHACTTECSSTLSCKLTPKCGYKFPAGACSTCTEGACCNEAFDCTADGDCFLCLKNADADPSCATNALRKKLATCVATSCKTECQGSGLCTGADPPPEETTDPAAEPAPDPNAGKTTTTTTDGCAMSAKPRTTTDGAFALATLAFALLAAKRRRAA